MIVLLKLWWVSISETYSIRYRWNKNERRTKLIPAIFVIDVGSKFGATSYIYQQTKNQIDNIVQQAVTTAQVEVSDGNRYRNRFVSCHKVWYDIIPYIILYLGMIPGIILLIPGTRYILWYGIISYHIAKYRFVSYPIRIVWIYIKTSSLCGTWCVCVFFFLPVDIQHNRYLVSSCDTTINFG